MKKFDYIIVGQGLAGTVLSYKLSKLGKSIYHIDKHRANTSSKIAPGVYNPLVLKRYTKCWRVDEQLEPLMNFINDFETDFNVTIHQPIKLWRLFNSIQEQNLWFEKSQKDSLSPYMKCKFIKNPHEHLNASYGFGEVSSSGRVIISKMIQTYREHLLNKGLLLNEDFDYSLLDAQQNSVHYRDVICKKIIFCEGFRMNLNPFFNYLPMMGTKGELVTVRLKGLNVSQQIKSKLSVLPLGDDVYKVGATFNWDDKTEVCTQSAREELLNKLNSLVSINPELIKQEAGLRPTVKDRRALLGTHPKYKNVCLFNGLGTRGVLIAPYLSDLFIHAMVGNGVLDKEVDINRFESYLC